MEEFMREVVSKKGRYTSRQENLGANLQDVRNRLYFLRFSGKWRHARDESEGSGKSDLRAREGARNNFSTSSLHNTLWTRLRFPEFAKNWRLFCKFISGCSCHIFFASFERVLYITKRLFSHRYITRTRERERSYRTWVWQCGVSRANTHILSECILVVAHSLKRLNFISQPALSAKKLSFPKMTPAMIPPGLQLCVFVSCRCTMMTFRMLLQNNNNREDEPRDVNIKKADWLRIWAQNAGWMTSRTHYDDF